jgi:hypothetical protein
MKEEWKQAELITDSAIDEWEGLTNPDITMPHLICTRLREANIIKDTVNPASPVFISPAP